MQEYPLSRCLTKFHPNSKIIYKFDEYFYEREITGLNTKKVVEFCNREIKAGMQNQRAVFSMIMLYEWNKFNNVQKNPDGTYCQ